MRTFEDVSKLMNWFLIFTGVWLVNFLYVEAKFDLEYYLLQNGNMEVTSVLQTKDASMCAWAARLLALFYNWVVSKRQRPHAFETDW
jgi:hypothetical protein